MRRSFGGCWLFSCFALVMAANAIGAQEVKAIALANAGALDAAVLERVRAFAQQELDVPVRAFDIPKTNALALQDAAAVGGVHRRSNDVCLITLVAPERPIPLHLATLTDIQAAVVNVSALRCEDPEAFARRIERMVLRGAAALFGLPASPDPYCVTRNYVSDEDLDRMGRNFCPPWRERFAEEAKKRGLASPAADGAPVPKGGE